MATTKEHREKLLRPVDVAARCGGFRFDPSAVQFENVARFLHEFNIDTPDGVASVADDATRFDRSGSPLRVVDEVCCPLR